MWKNEVRKYYRSWLRIQKYYYSTSINQIKRSSETISSIVTFGLFGSSFYYIDKHCFNITTCVGPSMLPTFRADGDIVIVLKESSYEVGDVVICESISNSQKTVCKRLAGVAGDTVEMYVPGLFSTRSLYREIPIDHVWILGDNPQNSHDSRHYGPVPITHLKGRVAYKIRLLEFPNIIQKVERVKPSLKFEI